MFQHLVVVELKHPPGSAEEADFLERCLMLATIPGVQRFERMRQGAPDLPYRLAFSMWFEDEPTYLAYRAHPVHDAFTDEVWTPNVVAGADLDLTRI